MARVKDWMQEQEDAASYEIETQFPRWTVDFEYGYYTAIHDNYDASWEGEEDGWVDNGLKVTARTVGGLLDEIKAKEEELVAQES